MAQTFVPAEDDYYGILQISQHACKQVIKAAYKALALMRHPDQNVDSPDAIKEFQLVCVSSCHHSLRIPHTNSMCALCVVFAPIAESRP